MAKIYSTKDTIYEKLKKYCAYQERSQKEVEQKIFSLTKDKEMADEIILSLIHENFLKEERYALAYARGKFRINGWGKQKIKQGLKLNAISDHLISKALLEIDEEEYRSKIKYYYNAKLNSLNQLAAAEQKRKAIQFLLQKGFEYNDIVETIQSEDL
ncbi:MAG TPA: regulatory protein RecX [Saprospiraceae bacterium]|nr:regulatory protein RecX [Saprospiraceae bacterium]